MTRVPVDVDEAVGAEAPSGDAEGGGPEPQPSSSRARRRRYDDTVEVEIEREITKRTLIEAVTSVVVVVLYMVFTLLRDRESGVVVLDDKDTGPADDWDEA